MKLSKNFFHFIKEGLIFTYLLFGETEAVFLDTERRLEFDLFFDVEDLLFGDSLFLFDGGDSALLLGVRDLLDLLPGEGDSLLGEERLLGVGDLRLGERERRLGVGERLLFVSDRFLGVTDRFRERDLIYFHLLK